MDDKSEQSYSATEAKALVALGFRLGPIENVHAGKRCPTCEGQPGYERITQAEMKTIMKSAVNQLYRLLRLKAEDPRMYESEIRRGAAYTAKWDEPADAPNHPESRSSSQLQLRLPEGGVLVTVPLASLKSVGKKANPPYSFAQLRNRLEQIVSHIGLMLESRGLASAHECKVERNRLNLMLAGSDTKAIATELRSYLYLLRLPERAKLVVFAAGASEPEEIDLN